MDLFDKHGELMLNIPFWKLFVIFMSLSIIGTVVVLIIRCTSVGISSIAAAHSKKLIKLTPPKNIILSGGTHHVECDGYTVHCAHSSSCSPGSAAEVERVEEVLWRLFGVVFRLPERAVAVSIPADGFRSSSQIHVFEATRRSHFDRQYSYTMLSKSVQMAICHGAHGYTEVAGVCIYIGFSKRGRRAINLGAILRKMKGRVPNYYDRQRQRWEESVIAPIRREMVTWPPIVEPPIVVRPRAPSPEPMPIIAVDDNPPNYDTLLAIEEPPPLYWSVIM